MTYSRPCVQVIRVFPILPLPNKTHLSGKLSRPNRRSVTPNGGDLVRGSVPQNATQQKLSHGNHMELAQISGGLLKNIYKPPIFRCHFSFRGSIFPFCFQKRICPSDTLTMRHRPTRHSDPWGQRRPEIVGSRLVSHAGWKHV